MFGRSFLKRLAASAVAAAASVFIFYGCSDTDLDSSGKVDKGHDALLNFDIAGAVKAYEEAYEADNNNPDAIVYSTLAKFASISTDPKMVSFIRDRVGFSTYPATFNALLSDNWMTAYYDEYYDWWWDEEVRDEVMLPALAIPAWVKGGSNSIYNGTLLGDGAPSVETWGIVFLANLLEKNTDGLNSLLDGLIDAVFGASFDEMCARVDKLKDKNAKVKLPAAFIVEFKFGDAIDEFDYIGWAELNALLSFMTGIKASLQWIAAYDWNTNLNFLKYAWSDEDAFYNQLATKLDASDLPFNNNFLNPRPGKMEIAKATFVEAVTGIKASYTAIQNDRKYPSVVKGDTYKALNSGADALIAAINNGKIFYIPEEMPSGNWPTNGTYGIDMGKLFTPGYFSLPNLFETEDGKPVFYADGMRLDEYNYEEEIDYYRYASLKFNVAHITAIVIGLEEEIEDAAYISLFPDRYGKLFFEKYYGLPHSVSESAALVKVRSRR